MSYTTEIFYHVYDDDHGAYIQIGPDADSLGCVEIRTDTSTSNKEYFGDFRLALQPAMALELGRALIAAAEQMGVK